MKSYILLRTAAIFFLSNLYLKEGIDSVYVMVDFILQGLPRVVRNASWTRVTKWKILAECGIRIRDVPLAKRRRYHWATRTDVCRSDKSSPAFNCAILLNLPVAHGWSSKIMCRVFLPYNICIDLLFGQLRSLLTVKSLQNVIHHKIFCYIYYVLQVNF